MASVLFMQSSTQLDLQAERSKVMGFLIQALDPTFPSQMELSTQLHFLEVESLIEHVLNRHQGQLFKLKRVIEAKEHSDGEGCLVKVNCWN